MMFLFFQAKEKKQSQEVGERGMVITIRGGLPDPPEFTDAPN
jgi:hypothetical protein